MTEPIKLKLPVTPNGVIEPIISTPEEIEAKRLVDEKILNDAKLLELKEAPELIIDNKTYLVSKEGDAYNSDGSLFKKKDELNTAPIEPLKEGEEVEIEVDNKVTKYKIDKDGNAVDDKGVVFKTKIELTALLNVQPETEAGDDPFDIIQEVLQFKPTLNGQPIVYEKTTNGLKKLTLDAATEIGQNIAQQEIQKFFEENPDIQQMRTHKTLNGDLSTYIPQPDWGKLNIAELDDDSIVQIIVQERTTKGDSIDIIKFFVDGVKKDNKVKEFGTVALKYLADKQLDNKLKADLLIKQDADSRIESNRRYWEEVNTAIAAKKLVINNETFVLPNNFTVKDSDGKTVIKTITDFNEYISKARPFSIKGNVFNMTQNQYDMTIEQMNHKPANDVFEALRRFLHYDDSQLVAAKAKHEEVKTIRKLSINRPGVSGGGGTAIKLILPVKK